MTSNSECEPRNESKGIIRQLPYLTFLSKYVTAIVLIAFHFISLARVQGNNVFKISAHFIILTVVYIIHCILPPVSNELYHIKQEVSESVKLYLDIMV